jgi:hypothetical protein
MDEHLTEHTGVAMQRLLSTTGVKVAPRLIAGWYHTLTGHLSSGAQFLLWTAGPYGVKELRNLVTLLETQIAVLEDSATPLRSNEQDQAHESPSTQRE